MAFSVCLSRHSTAYPMLVFLLPFVFGTASAESQHVGFQNTGAQLGWGWDSTLEEAKPNICIEFEPATEGAQTVNMSINEVSSQSELLEKMDLTVTASVKAMVSVEGKASFAKEVSVNSSSSSFLVKASIDNGYEYTAPAPLKTEPVTQDQSLWSRFFSNSPQGNKEEQGRKLRLTPWAVDLAKKTDNLESFRHQCGDSFVQAIYGGAELYGLVTIESSVKGSNQKFSEEVTGSYSFVQAGEAFESSIKEIDENAKITVTFFQVGGSGGVIASDRNGFIEKLKSITRETAENPKHTRIAVLPYSELANWPSSQDTDPEEHELNEMLAEYWNFTSLYKDVQRVLAHPDKFLLGKGINEDGLRQLEDELNVIRARLERMARDNSSLPKPLTLTFIPKEQMERAQKIISEANDRKTVRPSTALRTSETLLRLNDDLTTLDSWKPNINWFKVKMPLPLNAIKTDDYEDPDLRRWIVDWYIGRLAKRQCDASPSARGCLSNAELAQWEDRVILTDVNNLHYGAATGPGEGEPFDDGHNWRVQESRLRKIVAYPFELGPETPLFGLEFFYDNADGTTFSTGVHGDAQKRLAQTFQLQPDEYLIKTELHLRESVFDAISFTTNKGRIFDPFKSAGYKVKTKDLVFEHQEKPLLAFYGEICKESAGGDRYLIWPCKLGPIFKNTD